MSFIYSVSSHSGTSVIITQMLLDEFEIQRITHMFVKIQ